jgi:hypothetical protein
MSQAPRSPEPSGQEGGDAPRWWAGAPGFTPFQDVVMPHAPMPGAPPYPPAVAPPPAAPPLPGPGMGSALVVAGSWALVSIVVALVVGGAPGIGEFGPFLLGLGAPTLLTALAVRFVARRRGWPFWLLVVAAAPVFWVLHSLQNLIRG